MADYATLFIESIFVENLALAFFLGICTFLAVSKKIATALGLGLAVVVAQGITVPVNNVLFQYFLKDGALSWAGLPEVDLRARKEINGTCIHLIFRPSLADLQSRNPQNSTTIPPVSLIQIDQIWPKSQRLHVPRISLRTLNTPS